MSNFVFLVNLILPTTVPTVDDITDRAILDRCGDINRGVSAAEDLFAFVSGDLTMEFNNQDGYFDEILESDPVDLSRLNSIADLIQIDLFRDGVRHFRGFVLPQSIKQNRREATIALTILGPMRLIDTVKAARLNRVFPENLLVATGAALGATAIILSVDVPLLTGDTIGIGVDDTVESVLTGYDSATKTATLATALDRAVAQGEVVTCLTPFPRNQDMFVLAQQLFGLGNIVDTDIRFTGLIGSRPFLTSFNTLGIGNAGELRGLKQAQLSPAVATHKLIASLQVPSATTTVETSASTPFVGFAPLAGSPVVMTIDYGAGPVNIGNGGWKDFADQGGLAGEVVEGYESQNVYRKPMDSISVSGVGALSHTVVRKVFDVVRTVGGQTYLYELSVTQSVVDVNDPGPGNFPDYEIGGLGYLVCLKRFTTVNGGLAWTIDLNFIPSFAAPALVVNLPAATTYKYRIEAYSNNVIASSQEATTNVGPNAALGIGGRQITLTWGAVAGATNYVVYRTAAGNGEALGRLASTGGPTTWIDSVITVTTSALPSISGQYNVASDPNFTGSGLAIADWCLSAHPFLDSTGASYDQVLYFSGLFGEGSVVSNFQNRRIRINGGIIDAINTVHFGAAACKAIFTRPYAITPRRVDFYYWDLSSSVPGIVHTQDNGVAHTAGTGAIYNTGINPLVRSFKWNQIDGVGGRVLGLYSNKTIGSGTGYLIMTPGNTQFAGTFEGLFVTEFQGVIDPDYFLRFDSSAHGSTVAAQVCSNITTGIDAEPRNDSAHIAVWTVNIGGSGPQKVMVGYAANKWFIASRYHTGFLSEADFGDMSASRGLQEIAFVLNAFVNVDWSDSVGPLAVPFGTFLSRDLPAFVAPKLLANLDGSAPAGAYQDIVIDAEYDRAWSQSAPFVKLTGSGEGVEAVSGIDDMEQQGMEVDAKFVATADLAQTIADTLFAYYGPGWPVSQAPLVTPQNAPGIAAYWYVIVATANLDPRLAIKAISTVGKTSGGNTTLSASNFNAIIWSGTSGATFYHVYRVYSTGFGNGGTLGRLATVTGSTTYDDVGLVGGVPALPSRLKQPRQAATFPVIDDRFLYLAGGEVQFPDLLGHTDLGEPTASPVVPPDPTKPPRWRIENIDYNPTEPEYTLQVVEKDVPPL